MSTAVRPRGRSAAPEQDTAGAEDADVFVVFGITGDLAKVTELRLVFKPPPRLGFGVAGPEGPEPDQLVVKLDPSTGIRLIVEAQRADSVTPERINLDMEFAEEGGEGATPYEVLLHAAMVGDSKRFTRQDSVEEAWRVMQPLLDAPPQVHAYEKGSWGTATADELVAASGGWHGPWVAS